MSTPGLAGRPATPPAAPAPELVIARMHGHARRLVWSALLLVATAGAVAYFYDNLALPWENWMLLCAAGAVVLVGTVLPLARWLTRTYTVTTRRVSVKDGFLSRSKRDLFHAGGYGIRLRRGPLQRLWGAGTITLSDGTSPPLVLHDVPDAGLVHEVLADQVEMSQIQAHRDSQGFSFGHQLPPA